MKQPAAPTSLNIKIISAIVIALDAGLFVGALSQRMMLLPAVGLAVVTLVCWYFWTPVAYELADGELTVFFRLCRKRYGPVVRCAAMDARRSCTLRLFGNGGLFAGSGIFWNRQLGVFRAYVTTSHRDHLMLVVTGKTKILISPADPRGFLVAPS